MFVRHYLKAKDQYLCRIFVWLDVAEIAVVLFLQLMDIRDLTQTLWMTHVMIGLAVLYFIYTICNKFYHHTTTHALWICTIGSIILIGALFPTCTIIIRGHRTSDLPAASPCCCLL